MADDKPKAPDETALAGRVDGIETRLRRSDALSKRAKIVQRIAVALLLFFVLLFVYRIYAHVRSYAVALKDADKREAILKEFLSQARAEPILRSEAQSLVQDIQEKVLPKVFEDVVAEFNRSKPELEKMAAEMGTRLAEYVKTTVATRLKEAMTQSYSDLEAEIRKGFGEVTDEQFKRDFDASREIFIRHFSEQLELRLDKIQTGLEDLRETIKTHYGKDFAPELSGEEKLARAETVFIEALIDLIVYELKPDLGDEPFRPAAN
jgi:cell division protein FtsB